MCPIRPGAPHRLAVHECEDIGIVVLNGGDESVLGRNHALAAGAILLDQDVVRRSSSGRTGELYLTPPKGGGAHGRSELRWRAAFSIRVSESS